jgi:2-polyprenyl-3-methyl-5-hydroxy-6-metoxy-1,4-benzoquinol methylase
MADELAKTCPNTETALDYGCGTGQLSVLLGNVFNHVIATDASQKQIENAETHPKVTYKVAVA